MIPVDIIRMAREAGATQYTNRHLLDRPFTTFSPEALERFITMAVAVEREACAKAADDQWVKNPNVSGGDAIRAKSQQTGVPS